MTDREVAVAVAWHYLGKPYLWGGDDPQGFDCSGLVIEALPSCGRYPRGKDTTADGLRRLYPEIEPDEVAPGDLVFWLRQDGKASHVGMVIDPRELYIGAEGGGSWVPCDGLLLLGIVLGMLGVCLTSRRRDREKPETYDKIKHVNDA